MATTNSFDLLVDDDNDDLAKLIEKLPPPAKKLPAQAAAQPAQAAKMPSKPLPPAQAGKLTIYFWLLSYVLIFLCFC